MPYTLDSQALTITLSLQAGLVGDGEMGRVTFMSRKGLAKKLSQDVNPQCSSFLSDSLTKALRNGSTEGSSGLKSFKFVDTLNIDSSPSHESLVRDLRDSEHSRYFFQSSRINLNCSFRVLSQNVAKPEGVI